MGDNEFGVKWKSWAQALLDNEDVVWVRWDQDTSPEGVISVTALTKTMGWRSFVWSSGVLSYNSPYNRAVTKDVDPEYVTFELMRGMVLEEIEERAERYRTLVEEAERQKRRVEAKRFTTGDLT